jgi:hypothetical protein
VKIEIVNDEKETSQFEIAKIRFFLHKKFQNVAKHGKA